MINEKKVALILPGGGAKGAFQVGAEKYFREVLGYKWDAVLGISVGSLNASLIACEKYDELYKVWSNIKKSDIFSFRNPISFLFNGSYLTNKKPLEKLIRKHFNQKEVKIPLIVGSVNYNTGEFYSVNLQEEPLLAVESIMASCSIPMFWEPTKMHGDYYIDGGIVNNNPISFVLGLDIDEIIIIALDKPNISQRKKPTNLLDFTLRVNEISNYYLMDDDIKHFFIINKLVEQAEKLGYKLYSPSGKEYKKIKATIVYPDSELCHPLDFDKKIANKLIEEGYNAAKKYCKCDY